MTDSSNGRVTMAVLGTKVDAVLEKLGQIEVRCQEDHDRLTVTEGHVDGHTRRIDELHDGLEGLGDDLKKSDNARKWESRIEALVVGIAR